MVDQLDNEELKRKIDLYVEGQLSPAEVDELWTELIQDERYMDYTKSVANLKTIVAERSKAEEVNKLPSYVYYAAAAVVALLITVLGVINFASSSSDLTVSPVADVELEYYRSADGSLTSGEAEEVVQRAIALSNKGSQDQAIGMLQTSLEENKISPTEKVEMSLTLASLYYNREQYDKAINIYNKIIDRGNQTEIDVLALEKAYWYRGNAYFQKDQLKEAKADIKKAYELNGAYRRVAERYLNALSG
jgi:tetratricopeptide (TPR) repeat protein